MNDHRRDDHDYLTAKEVAAMFRVAPRAANRWARGGLLGAVRPAGRQWLFPRSAVEAALATPPTVDTSDTGPAAT
ncbi:hypothetical protein Lfu02_77130 [Longispora fulva]|uniref:Excisionase family DNA binding protein n=1 Tax=Longispora fulva TaxID=619741 RepID=A0A8J7GQE7_9ACTN|nr:helix-turn-helix domain-containing protein [Longispora fulva]MBG6136168.1 excisionase family DNA binding protein [Longispora fulva]GIG63341.1 hypothetical protein Lfu02_77130 [Longispora fulva]